jgi:1,4-dihydroxy-2-naphthoate octaprenyltransferase
MKSKFLKIILLVLTLIFYVGLFPRELQIGAPSIFMLGGACITIGYMYLVFEKIKL